MRGENSVLIALAILGAIAAIVMGADFYIDYVEYNKMRMVFRSANNYAICNPDFKANWRAFSFNNKIVTILGLDNKTVVKNWSELSKEEIDQADSSFKVLNNIRSSGPNSVQGNLVRVSSYDLSGSVSTSGFGGGGSASSMSVNGMSVSKSGEGEYVIFKNDLPYNWVRLFIHGDFVSTVNKDGYVLMTHMNNMNKDERVKLNEIMEPIKKMDGFQDNMMKSIHNPMDFVSKAMGGMFGR